MGCKLNRVVVLTWFNCVPTFRNLYRACLLLIICAFCVTKPVTFLKPLL